MQLDELDKAIIVALEDDGRRPFRDIARDLKVSESTVRSRVSRLQDRRLIHITAVGDPLQLGVEAAAIILVRVRPGTVAQTASTLARLPYVRFVGTSFGQADIVIQTLHGSVKELHAFVTEELPSHCPDITSTETFQLAEVMKSSWDWREWFAQSEHENAAPATHGTTEAGGHTG
ncbi:MAG: Lrp/AsnC family transcriptional regulator [Deinococcales bacterium]